MRKSIFALFAAVVLAGLALPAGAQERVRFNPDYSSGDIRAEYGVYAALDESKVTYRMAQATYTRRFWGPLAWRAGALATWKGLDGFYGAPIGLSLRSRTYSMGEALTDAVVYSTMDAIDYTYFGRNYDSLGGAIFWNFLVALFRRSEFTLGLTPGVYTGYRHLGFGLTGDVGAVLAIPIWRLSLNITPVLHYALVPDKRPLPEDNSLAVKPSRLFLSATIGIEYMF